MEQKLRLLGFIEATSLIILVLIAMPLKYIYGYPLLVRIMGSAHGFLWLLFIVFAYYVGNEKDWSLKKIFLAIVISTVPLGPFLFDKTIYGSGKYEEST